MRLPGSGGSDFAEVKVHPHDPDIVFTGSIVVWKSIDGGRTFTTPRGAPGGDDYQRIWINLFGFFVIGVTIVAVGLRTFGEILLTETV